MAPSGSIVHSQLDTCTSIGRNPTPDDIERLRALARATGAVESVERRVEAMTGEALAALRAATPVEPWAGQLAALAAWLQGRET